MKTLSQTAVSVMQLVPDFPRPHLLDMFKLLIFLNDPCSSQFYRTRLRQQ